MLSPNPAIIASVIVIIAVAVIAAIAIIIIIQNGILLRRRTPAQSTTHGMGEFSASVSSHAHVERMRLKSAQPRFIDI